MSSGSKPPPSGPSWSLTSSLQRSIRRLSHFLHVRLTQNVQPRRADVQLIAFAFSTGMIDAFTFADMQVFTANMTGNTVFLALAAASAGDRNLVHADRSILALACFWTGAFVGGQIGHRVGPRKRWWLLLSSLMQSLLLLVSAILLYTRASRPSAGESDESGILGLIVPLAFSFGAQAALARGLTINEIPTVVITSAFADIFADKNLFHANNLGRNRRMAFVITLFLGAFVGSWVLKEVHGSLVVLLAFVVKTVAATSFWLNPGDEP